MSKDYHYPLPKDDAKTPNQAIIKIRYSSKENLYIFRKGSQFRRFVGETNRVTIPREYLFELKDAEVVHNHTGGTSMSKEDVEAIVRYDAKRLILVTKNFIYRVDRPQDGWPIDFDDAGTHALFESCKSLAEDVVNKLIAANEVSFAEKDMVIFHYIWILFFDKNNIQYGRKEHI